MQSIIEKIAQLEEEIRKTPYHKGTEHHIGRLRAKIAKLKEELTEKKIGSSEGGQGYAVKKTGDATVVLVGPPSVGKSTLINKITAVSSKVADYEFTTLGIVPGIMEYKGAKIQILDAPGIISGAAQGKGRGKQVLGVVRTTDLILIMVDVESIFRLPEIKKELYQFGIRLDESRPKITINKLNSGGIKVVSTTPLTHLSLTTIIQVAQEFKIRNGEIIIKEDLTLERLVDAFMGNRCYLPYLVVVNKIDTLPSESKKENGFLYISAQKDIGLEKLKEEIWKKLGLFRVYLKPKNAPADFQEPLIAKNGQTLRQILEKINISDKERIKKAKIFGPGAKFPGQEVSLDFLPREETVINFLI